MANKPDTVAELPQTAANVAFLHDAVSPAAIDPRSAIPIDSHASTPLVVLPPTQPVIRFADMAENLPASLPLSSKEGYSKIPQEDGANQSTEPETKCHRGEKGKFKHPRYSRRVQSKSEPSTSNSA